MFSAFVSLIGLAIIWIIIFITIGFVVNSYRVRNGENINDSVSSFIQGLALGPIAIMSGFDPRQKAMGKSGGLIFGGIVGTFGFLITYAYL